MLHKLLKHLVNNGVVIEIFKTENGIVYDLNLRSKSHMHLYEKEGQWFVDMRYNRTVPITNIENVELSMKELTNAAIEGVHGRSFIDGTWLQIILDSGADDPRGNL